jgi:hypothetical protein
MWRNIAHRFLTKPQRRRLAASVIGKHGAFYRALGSNADLQQWLLAQGQFPYFRHRSELYDCVNRRIVNGDSIDYLELGVYFGESIFKWASINTHPDSRFTGFDSFEGLPEDWECVLGTVRKGAYSAGGAIPTTTDSRICFVKGLFSETLRPFLNTFRPHSRLVVHNDADLFSSTLFTLCTLDPILVAGSILIFDEFDDPLHEWEAFKDYVSAFGRAHRLLAAAGEYYRQVALELT